MFQMSQQRRELLLPPADNEQHRGDVAGEQPVVRCGDDLAVAAMMPGSSNYPQELGVRTVWVDVGVWLLKQSRQASYAHGIESVYTAADAATEHPGRPDSPATPTNASSTHHRHYNAAPRRRWSIPSVSYPSQPPRQRPDAIGLDMVGGADGGDGGRGSGSDSDDGSSPPSSISSGVSTPQEEEDEGGGAPEDASNEPERKICGPALVPFTIEFEDVKYSVKLPATAWYRFNSKKRQVLFDVSGNVQPGELLALMGPSGSGKTTLLNVIGGRVRNTKDISGSILFNGKPMSRYVRRYVAFVLQDDLLFSHLTARETLHYAALLKLPHTMTFAEKLKAANNVLRLLRLEKCAGTKIGGPFSRGLSGGERKRVSIGVEMLNNPSILMMDEPTSGLDSFVAMQLIDLLKEIARKESRTIIISIHQPSSQVFYLFDKLLLLVDGRVAFRGPLDDVVPMFVAEGVPPPPNYNPADFMMAIMAERPEVAKRMISLMEQQWPTEKAKRATFVPKLDRKGRTDFERIPLYETTVAQQILILLRRQFKQQFFQIVSWLNIAQALTIAILAGLLWIQTPYSELHVTDRFALVFFLVVFWSFNAFVISMNTFPAERGVLWKERKAKYYRLSAFMTARWITESSIILIIPLVCITITYFIAGLQYTFLSWFETVLIIILNMWVLQGLSLFLAVVVPTYQQAVMLGTTVLLGSMLVGGFYIRYLPNWLIWTKYLSVIFYAASLAELVQFNDGVIFRCEVEPRSRSQFAPCAAGQDTFNGSQVMEAEGIFDVWGLYMGILLGLVVVFRVLCYIALRPQL